jgi:hypothetical protein
MGSNRVAAGPWHVAHQPVAQQELAGWIEVSAQDAEGRARWTPQPDWQDGRVLEFAGQPWTACRWLRAETAVELWVGLGGGDRITVYLNGRKAFAAETALPYRRYGTSMRLDGTRHDQVVAKLSLQPGEHQLVLQIEQQSPGPRQFYFSLAADPVGYLWRQLEQDFPRDANPLLTAVPAAWFAADGWLARNDPGLEREFVDEVDAMGRSKCHAAPARRAVRTGK